jgi:cellulose biosynthesis protein BcsQ
MKNRHLNFFHFYAESESVQHQENNLTRALAICLQHEPLFLYTFLQKIVDKEELHPQFHLINEDDEFQISIQQPIRNLAVAEKVYAVALTENILDLATYSSIDTYRNSEPITDMTIRFKDILIILEVKRNASNCLGQLKGQLEKYKEVVENDITEIPISVSWKEVLRMADDINNFCTMLKQPADLVRNFTEFIRSRYPEWDEPIPFSSIPFLVNSTVNTHPIYRRLHTILQKQYGDELMYLKDRVSIPVKEPWASEALMDPTKGPNDEGYVNLRVYPGNTKGQGWSLFTNPAGLAWSKQKALVVNGKSYQLIIEPYIKFANNYGSYLFELILCNGLEKYTERFINRGTFEELAGRWNKVDASKLEHLLDSLTDEKWRKQIGTTWNNEFINSGRNVINVSLGFEVYILIPYEELRQLDRSMSDTEKVGKHIAVLVDELKALINGKNQNQ